MLWHFWAHCGLAMWQCNDSLPYDHQVFATWLSCSSPLSFAPQATPHSMVLFVSRHLKGANVTLDSQRLERLVLVLDHCSGTWIKALTCSNRVSVNRLALKTNGTHCCDEDVVGSSRKQGGKCVIGGGGGGGVCDAPTSLGLCADQFVEEWCTSHQRGFNPTDCNWTGRLCQDLNWPWGVRDWGGGEEWY